MSAQTHQVPTPLSRRKVRPEVMSSRPSARSEKPTPSRARPGTGSDSGHAEQDREEDERDGDGRHHEGEGHVLPPSASNSSPAPIAPTMAPASSATTSRPAARRVCEAAVPVRRPRSKISAISSGSQTT